MKNLFYILFLISFSLSAQIKGVVKDSITGKPISFVNIWVQDENIGFTSEENGEFSINASEINKKLLFSALGYEKKTVLIKNNTEVKLKPTDYQLEEVLIFKTLGTKIIEIGKTKNATYQAFDNGPKIDVKFFPYLEKYKKTKYLKKVSIFTDNSIENASFKIHFYSVDTNGFPSTELLDKDFIVAVKKGVTKNIFDVTKFKLQIPKNGIFVGFEKLLIEKNKLEKSTKDANTNTEKIITKYFPLLLYNKVEIPSTFTFSGGKWNKKTNNSDNLKDKISVNEPAITLILTN